MQYVKNYFLYLNHSWDGGKLIIKEIELVYTHVFMKKSPSWEGLQGKSTKHLTMDNYTHWNSEYRKKSILYSEYRKKSLLKSYVKLLHHNKTRQGTVCVCMYVCVCACV